METVNLTPEQFEELEGIVMDLSSKLERASIMIEELREEYFSNLPTESNLWELLAGFGGSSIKTDIAFDYVRGSRQLIEQAEKLLLGGSEQ